MGLHTMGGVTSITNKLESNSLRTCFNRVIPDNDPSPSNPISVASFITNAILLDTIVNSSANGTAGGTYTISGYTGAPSGAQSLGTSNHMKYIDMGAGSQGNITISATATYPHHILGFYTATGGGGSQLVAGGTSTTTLSLTQTSTFPSANNIWVHFGESSASSANEVSLGTGNNAAVACTANPGTYWTDGSAGTVISNSQPIYTNSAGTTHASAGWYSSNDGSDAGYYNGSGAWSSTQLCTF